jgi:hypothetical protein
MSSPSSPPPPEPDDWQPAEDLRGQWEDDAAGRSRAGNRLADALRAALGPLWSDPRSRPLLLVSGFALLGICALSCFILVLALFANRDPEPRPTPIAEATTTPAPQPTAELFVVRVNETPLPAPIPSRLIIGNTTYRVAALTIRDAQWDYDPRAPQTAYWVPGTLVNIVLGLPAGDENRQVIATLRPGDLIVLETGLGPQRYRVIEQQTIQDTDVVSLLAQDAPRLSLVLLGSEGNQRQVVIAGFADEGTPNQLSAVGTPINLGDLRVRVLGHRLLPGASVGLAAERAYLQVDFEVTNIITRILDAAQFFSALADAGNTTYPLSIEASQAAGGRGFARGALQPEQTIVATAGFEIPANLPGPTLEWRFAIDKETPYVARVAIPHQPLAVDPAPIPTQPPRAEVTIVNAQISPEGNELRVVGSVRNLTSQFLSASLSDAALSGPGGQLYPLNSSLPAFPWSITPGESLVFQLSFARPQSAGPFTFTLFDQSFRICEPGQPCE